MKRRNFLALPALATVPVSDRVVIQFRPAKNNSGPQTPSQDIEALLKGIIEAPLYMQRKEMKAIEALCSTLEITCFAKASSNYTAPGIHMADIINCIEELPDNIPLKRLWMYTMNVIRLVEARAWLASHSLPDSS